MTKGAASYDVVFQTNVGDVPALAVSVDALRDAGGAAVAAEVEEVTRGLAPAFDEGTLGIYRRPLGSVDGDAARGAGGRGRRQGRRRGDASGCRRRPTPNKIYADASAQEMATALDGLKTLGPVMVSVRTSSTARRAERAAAASGWPSTALATCRHPRGHGRRRHAVQRGRRRARPPKGTSDCDVCEAQKAGSRLGVGGRRAGGPTTRVAACRAADAWSEPASRRWPAPAGVAPAPVAPKVSVAGPTSWPCPGPPPTTTAAPR